jgi:hypothetical protein
MNNGKILAGILIASGWLPTLLLEKPRGHHILKGGSDDPNIWESAKANPRGWIARPLAMSNNVANLWGALNTRDGERVRFKQDVLTAQENLARENTHDNQLELQRAKAKQHDYGWNVLTACSFLIAHVLFGISGSKRPKETDDDKAMLNDLVLLSANVLAKQPEQVRQTAIDQTANYVAGLAHITLGKTEIAGMITGKINALSHCSWAKRLEPAPQPSAQLSM